MLIITEHLEFGKVRIMEVRSGFASEMPPTAIANRRGATHQRPPHGKQPAESEVYR